MLRQVRVDLFAQVGCEGVEHGEELDELLLRYDGGLADGIGEDHQLEGTDPNGANLSPNTEIEPQITRIYTDFEELLKTNSNSFGGTSNPCNLCNLWSNTTNHQTTSEFEISRIKNVFYY